jgi:DNA-binding MarR family transcriptional regulator
MRQSFDLNQFLPYLLNQAAEVTSVAFQDSYRDHGLTRTEWRVMANLGAQGSLTAAQICRITFTDKTKISRAVQGLEQAGWLRRGTVATDRRRENLTLTDAGRILCRQIEHRALDFDAALRQSLGPAQAAALANVLQTLITNGKPARTPSQP